MTCKDCAEPHGIIESIVYWYEKLSLQKRLQGKDRARHRWMIRHCKQRGLSKKKRKQLYERRLKMESGREAK